jgi:hypothetical protein
MQWRYVFHTKLKNGVVVYPVGTPKDVIDWFEDE